VEQSNLRFTSSAKFVFSTLLCLIMIAPTLALGGCKSGAQTTSAVTTTSSVPAGLAADLCYTCHKASTPGITNQFASSVMAQKDVTCSSCHKVAQDYPGAQAHFGTYRLVSPTPARCQQCHADQVGQFLQGRHSLPSYVAVNGATDLTADQLAMYKAIPEGGYDPNKTEHPLAALEGPSIVPFACDACHQIGQPNPDGSVGRCQSCHLSHTYSLEQARKPETCNACHIGPDHPQFEIYQESAHGIRYATDGENWNWSAAYGKLTVQDMPAPTCATCHIAAFGGVPGSHDLGNRLTYFLAAQYSVARPDAAANKARMQQVCSQCHAVDFVLRFYDGANQLTTDVTARLKTADTIMQPLKDKGLLTAAPFDEPIDFVYFDIWHDWGRTTKFGSWMQGADYAQWHGVYEILRDLTVLQSMANDKLAKAK
jgi:hydroxylamine dehydrogenase